MESAWLIDFQVCLARTFPRPHYLIFKAVFKERGCKMRRRKGDPRAPKKIRYWHTFQTAPNKHRYQPWRKEMVATPLQTLLPAWGSSQERTHGNGQNCPASASPINISLPIGYCLQEFPLRTPNGCQSILLISAGFWMKAIFHQSSSSEVKWAAIHVCSKLSAS